MIKRPKLWRAVRYTGCLKQYQGYVGKIVAIIGPCPVRDNCLIKVRFPSGDIIVAGAYRFEEIL